MPRSLLFSHFVALWCCLLEYERKSESPKGYGIGRPALGVGAGRPGRKATMPQTKVSSAPGGWSCGLAHSHKGKARGKDRPGRGSSDQQGPSCRMAGLSKSKGRVGGDSAPTKKNSGEGLQKPIFFTGSAQIMAILSRRLATAPAGAGTPKIARRLQEAGF